MNIKGRKCRLCFWLGRGKAASCFLKGVLIIKKENTTEIMNLFGVILRAQDNKDPLPKSKEKP